MVEHNKSLVFLTTKLQIKYFYNSNQIMSSNKEYSAKVTHKRYFISQRHGSALECSWLRIYF